MNLVGGQFVAVFGSADRYLARVAALLGDPDAAERHFATALAMDRRMGRSCTSRRRSPPMPGRCTRPTRPAPARSPTEARALAEPIGHVRVLRRLEAVPRPVRPDDLTAREVEVLALLAEGPEQPGDRRRLFISANTAANHVRSILMKTGTANRTQAARYATEHEPGM